jgi:peptide/nickel transport system substrate-binding protein
VSQSLSEYASITQKIQQQWGAVGVEIEAILQPEEDIQSNALARHDYDVLLYGISIGFDPDVFAYWHSSQADPNSSSLNLSEFKNAVADEALEAGRTRVDETLRKVKYEPFLRQWQAEVPAVALYQPRFVMVTRGTFVGFESKFMSSATDRYWSIANWKIRNDETVKQN